jgi:hypothetical protein
MSCEFQFEFPYRDIILTKIYIDKAMTVSSNTIMIAIGIHFGFFGVALCLKGDNVCGVRTSKKKKQKNKKQPVMLVNNSTNINKNEHSPLILRGV